MPINSEDGINDDTPDVVEQPGTTPNPNPVVKQPGPAQGGNVLEALVARLAGKPAAVTQQMVEMSAHLVEVSALELRAAAASNPSHPHAEVFINSVLGKADGYLVNVEQLDLQALIQNRTTQFRDWVEDGVRKREKQLV